MSTDRSTQALHRPPLSLRHPRATIAATLALLTILGLIGLGLEGRLSPTSLVVAGTESARGEKMVEAHFGASSSFVVLLRGPGAAIESQGPRLIAALRRDPDALVISPWDRGALSGLRPGPRRALVLIDYRTPLAEAMQETVPALETTLQRYIRPPLRADQSGFATISRALQHESLAASERAELLAAPLLLIVLLLVFRSALAAAIPLLFGALTVFSGRGVLALLSELMHVDALSLVVCTMMGLALGVDYSLLIVSRFREELDRLEHEPDRAPRFDRRLRAAHPLPRPEVPGRTHPTGDSDRDRVGSPRELSRAAAERTRESAGRTVALAGGTLFLAIFLTAFLQAGNLFISLALTLSVVTALSVAIAYLALPALLAILGPAINAGRLGRRVPSPASRPRVALIAASALRRPLLAALLISLPLLALAAPALAFNTGAPGVDELSASSPVRQSSEAIGRAVGPGWEGPFALVFADPDGPIATPARLALLRRAERRISGQPGVQAVLGPGPLADAARPVSRLGSELAGQSAPLSALSRIAPGLQRAAGGVGQVRGGIARASAGSHLLGLGAARAERGAGLLSAALGRAAEGGGRAASASARLASGTERLEEGQRRALGASANLSLGVRSLLGPLRSQGLAPARSLATELEAAARSDPGLAALAERARTLAQSLGLTRNEAIQLRRASQELRGGLTRLAAGTSRLRDGAGRLAAGAAELPEGLGRLSSGAERLTGGLGALRSGNESLSSHLADGYRGSRPLQSGLRRAARTGSSAIAPILRGAEGLRRDSPGLFDSGYFLLSALDGAPPARRALASEAFDLRRGQAARILVVSTAPYNSAGSRRIGARLRSQAEALGRSAQLHTALAGGAAIVNDYGTATRGRLPLVIGAIVALTFGLLLLVLRSPLLAALTVALNLSSVAAAIGVMSLICKLPAGVPLGGHPYIDTVGASAIFGVTFGLSIDYALFLLARMREKYDELGGTGSVPSEQSTPEQSTGAPAHARTREGGREISGADERARPGAEDMRGIDSLSRNQASIQYGLDKTASVITGAAAIMTAVFISFAIAPVATIGQMGVGLTVAVLLDATLVRIVLLPALMLLFGERVWQTPAWLERLPRLDLHGSEARA